MTIMINMKVQLSLWYDGLYFFEYTIRSGIAQKKMKFQIGFDEATISLIPKA